MTAHPISRTGRVRAACAAALIAGAAALALAGAAAAATAATTITSSNWSGYAAHGSSATFKTVSARWRIPAATCVKGDQSFASFWVGIGGYSESSTGLEQDGTELDCNADGTESVSAWYELLPAAPHTVSLSVHSGDLISASVHISNKNVSMKISDLSTGKSFSKTIRDNDIDDTSAEWIAEAPSDCTTDNNCTVLPLTDFGAVRFSNALATTTQGVTSGISTNRWTTTKLLLGYKTEGKAFVAEADSGDATPSALAESSTEFTVAWSGSQATSTTTTTTGSGTGSGSGGSSGSGGTSGSGSGAGAPGSGGSGTGSGGTPNPGGGGYGGGQGGQGPGSGGPGGGGSGF